MAFLNRCPKCSRKWNHEEGYLPHASCAAPDEPFEELCPECVENHCARCDGTGRETEYDDFCAFTRACQVCGGTGERPARRSR
jgi:hypothetical protein